MVCSDAWCTFLQDVETILSLLSACERLEHALYMWTAVQTDVTAGPAIVDRVQVCTSYCAQSVR
jgi:hypothetical protein